jgi:gluconokinase
VASQFEALEDPAGEAGVLGVDARLPLEQVVQRVLAWLRKPG